MIVIREVFSQIRKKTLRIDENIKIVCVITSRSGIKAMIHEQKLFSLHILYNAEVIRITRHYNLVRL